MADESKCSECSRLIALNRRLLGACKFLWDQAELNHFGPQESWTECAYTLTEAVIVDAEQQATNATQLLPEGE